MEFEADGIILALANTPVNKMTNSAEPKGLHHLVLVARMESHTIRRSAAKTKLGWSERIFETQ